MSASVQIEDRALLDALRAMRLSVRGASAAGAMRQIGRTLKTSTQLRFRDQVSPGGDPWRSSVRATRDGGQTLRDSSRLRNSITYVAAEGSVSVGTNVRYAAIHQFGGVIRPKTRKFLAIPLTPQARNAGSPRNFPGGLGFIQSLKGQFLLVDSKTGQPHYLLRRSVNVVARPFLGISHSDRAAILAIVTGVVRPARTSR